MNYTTIKSSFGLVTQLVPLKEYKVAWIGKRPNVSAQLNTEIQQYEGNSFHTASASKFIFKNKNYNIKIVFLNE